MKKQPPARLTYTVNEVCEITGLGRTWVYEKLITSGVVESFLAGKKRLVVAESLHQWVAERRFDQRSSQRLVPVSHVLPGILRASEGGPDRIFLCPRANRNGHVVAPR